jgi:hypothetical protein
MENGWRLHCGRFVASVSMVIEKIDQKRRISWTRILVLAQRWLPLPQALHPFPDARFAASHLR